MPTARTPDGRRHRLLRPRRIGPAGAPGPCHRVPRHDLAAGGRAPGPAASTAGRSTCGATATRGPRPTAISNGTASARRAEPWSRPWTWCARWPSAIRWAAPPCSRPSRRRRGPSEPSTSTSRRWPPPIVATRRRAPTWRCLAAAPCPLRLAGRGPGQLRRQRADGRLRSPVPGRLRGVRLRRRRGRLGGPQVPARATRRRSSRGSPAPTSSSDTARSGARSPWPMAGPWSTSRPTWPCRRPSCPGPESPWSTAGPPGSDGGPGSGGRGHRGQPGPLRLRLVRAGQTVGRSVSAGGHGWPARPGPPPARPAWSKRRRSP